MDFKKVNNWTGWMVTLIACTVYIMTTEATGSFWDCGEFISSAYKLQIPHPPGAPMFVLLGRIFIILFGDNPLTAAKAVNIMSALASGFTIMFLFWTITHFAKRIVQKGTEGLSNAQIISIMGAGIVGALAYTFSDSFWYSAVEGEVYALSSFFTALVFWAILKWEHKANQPGADKWIIFIFYLMGISIGVHLLNILTIPAIVMVYYFRNYKVNFWGAFIAFMIGVVITGFIQVFLIQYTVKWAGDFDVLFVNEFKLPFFSGFIAFFVLVAAVLAFAIHYANKKGLYFLKLGAWSTIFFLLGYTSYVTTMIRSNADPSVDMNNVDNPVTLVGYLGREQYGDWPIVYGPDFVDEVARVEGSEKFVKTAKNYEPAGRFSKNDWSSASNAHFFPRMWDASNDRQQFDAFQGFGGVEFEDDEKTGEKMLVSEEITMRNNIMFFTNYQLGFMYMRYFLWNFAGKQNDLQGFGNARDGNFITGISFIDNLMFGDQSKLPATAQSQNKANNKLYMLPLILGIIGFIYQLNRTRKDFLVTSLLFFFTGIAIVLYLNQQGFQPRERDYAYVGSFYAFAIWIGLGVLQIIAWFKNIMTPRIAAISATAVCFLAVPSLMAQQEWDDHDRSKKTFALDMARNYLESCPPNAILFSFGDNDTYPLWYAQEVEGIRPDVRVVVNSLLGSDWYMKELRYKVNQSEKFDVIFSEDQVAGEKLEVTLLNKVAGFNDSTYYNLDSVFRNIVANPKNLESLTTIRDGRVFNVFPSVKFKVPINKSNALKSGIAKQNDDILNELLIDYKSGVMYKNDLAMLAIISTSQFKRPICFTSKQELGKLGIDKYVRLRGISYELVPFKVNNAINTEASFNNVMTKFSFGNAKDSTIYFDEENRRHLSSLRLSFSQIADGLIDEGYNSLALTGDSSLLLKNKKKAIQVLRKLDSETNEVNFPYGMTSNRGNQHNYFSYMFLRSCFETGDAVLIKKVSNSLIKDLDAQIKYYKSLGDNMSEEDFYRNNQLHYSKQSNTLSDRQKSFVVDALSCYQLIEQVKQLGSNENRSSMSQESVKDTTPSKKIKDSLNKKSSK